MLGLDGRFFRRKDRFATTFANVVDRIHALERPTVRASKLLALLY